ncbi:MFS transporter [Cellulomonas bogoriensis]|uniref:MFS transporter n=1 Tax=Cellulomonas bogoriensis TaxID=301388 RepID=UPI0012EB2ADE|nr:MFS transporter [Cellulomonas bogoriensis]
MFFGSFGDEAAQVAFALRLADGSPESPAHISALLAAGLAGGILAGPLAPRVLAAIGARQVIGAIFLAEALLIAAASVLNELWGYLAVSAALGCLGAMLWSAVLVALPAVMSSEAALDGANRVVQTVRNLGYVVGPLLGAALFALSSGTRGLLILAALMLLAAPGVLLAQRSLVGPDVGRETVPGGRKGLDVVGLLRTPRVARALAPLIVTVLVTSALNVLLIVRVRSELELEATTYGAVVAGLSVGLVAGPLLLAKHAGRFGEPAGASLAAAVIGVAIAGLGVAQTAWQLVVAALVVGIANGVQNTLMAGFLMKQVRAEYRPHRMPSYVLILQSTVFAGFIGAGFIDVTAAGTALVAVGLVAMGAGTLGAVANWRSTPQPVTRGALP